MININIRKELEIVIKQANAYGELRALGKDDLATKLEAQNVQDKFNKSIEKLSSLLGDAVTAFMPLKIFTKK